MFDLRDKDMNRQINISFKIILKWIPVLPDKQYSRTLYRQYLLLFLSLKHHCIRIKIIIIIILKPDLIYNPEQGSCYKLGGSTRIDPIFFKWLEQSPFNYYFF
jgi:hypothetical protein